MVTLGKTYRFGNTRLHVRIGEFAKFNDVIL